MDPYKRLGIRLNPDGSLTRYLHGPHLPPTGDQLPPGCSDPALSKDVPLNKSHNTFIRFFRPVSSPNPTSKLPIMIYTHGAAFIVSSPFAVPFHNCCAQTAAEVPVLILSLKHRLAPERRLPAAYDDAVDALLWLRDQARGTTERWLDQADFSNVFLMGNSSGGNIALHLALRAMEIDLNPLKLSGLILYQPGFGGEERTGSELRLADDKVLPTSVLDMMFNLCLPEGADREHEYANLMRLKGKLKGLMRCLIRGYLGDPMIDRQRALAEMMEEEGVSVVKTLDVEGFHGIDFVDPDKATALLDDVKHFVNGGELADIVFLE